MIIKITKICHTYFFKTLTFDVFPLFAWYCTWLLWIQISGKMEDSACMNMDFCSLLNICSSFPVSGSVRRSSCQKCNLWVWGLVSFSPSRAWSQDKKWQKIDWKSESFCSWETLWIIQPWQPWLLGLANFQMAKAFMIVSLLDTEITCRLSSGILQRDKPIKPLSHSSSGNRH